MRVSVTKRSFGLHGVTALCQLDIGVTRSRLVKFKQRAERRGRAKSSQHLGTDLNVLELSGWTAR